MNRPRHDHQLTDEIPRLSIAKMEPGHYAYAVSCAGQMLYEAEGQSGIAEATLQAVDTKPNFAGFEVAYDGYLVGTFTLHELTADTEAVSIAAVSTKAKFFKQ